MKTLIAIDHLCPKIPSILTIFRKIKEFKNGDKSP